MGIFLTASSCRRLARLSLSPAGRGAPFSSVKPYLLPSSSSHHDSVDAEDTDKDMHKTALQDFATSLFTAATSSTPPHNTKRDIHQAKLTKFVSRSRSSKPRRRTLPSATSGHTHADGTAALVKKDRRPLPPGKKLLRITDIDQGKDEEHNHRQDRVECRFSRDLHIAIGSRNHSAALGILQALDDHRIQVETELILNLFDFFAESNPMDAFKVFQHAQAMSYLLPTRSMLGKLAQSVSIIDPTIHSRGDVNHFVGSFVELLEKESLDLQKTVYPILLPALLVQKCPLVGQHASQIYDRMVANDIEIPPNRLLHILSLIKYWRQDDVPVHDVLRRLSLAKFRPFPPILMAAVQSMFPFEDAKKAEVLLRAMLDIHYSSLEYDDSVDEATGEILPRHTYRIDIATLQAMSYSAAASKSAALAWLVWEGLEAMNLYPTETIYENTVVAIAGAKAGSLEHSFESLSAMVDAGYPVSRALLRSFSYSIRSSAARSKRAFRILSDPENSRLVSVASLNAVMSTFAERGETDDAFAVMDEFSKNGVLPDSQSYSFAMEVLGKELLRRGEDATPTLKARHLDQASALLSLVEERSIPVTPELLRAYVELLCIVGDVETATSVVFDFIEHDDAAAVSNKTLFRVAVENANLGNIDIAERLSAHTSERFEPLISAIAASTRRVAEDETDF